MKKNLVHAIERALDEIRPYLHSHGGDIAVVSVKETTVFVKFKGACVGCPISLYTLTLGVEEKIKATFPEITHVVAIDDDEDDR